MAEQEEVTTVSIDQLAVILDCDQRTIAEYHRKGFVVRVARGRYALIPSVTRTVRHLRTLAAGRQNEGSRADAAEETALLKRATRRRVELEVAQQESRLISMDEIKDVWGEILRAIRSMVLAWPSRCAFELPHPTAYDREVMKRIADEVLRNNSLANQEVGPLPEPKRMRAV